MVLAFPVAMMKANDAAMIAGVDLEVRQEPVVLLSSCCDLVLRSPPKRKGFILSPLRKVPKNIAKKPRALAALKLSPREAAEKGVAAPRNLFFIPSFKTAVEGKERHVRESVIHLEAVTFLPMDALRDAIKLAELTDEARDALRQRLWVHFAGTG